MCHQPCMCVLNVSSFENPEKVRSGYAMQLTVDGTTSVPTVALVSDWRFCRRGDVLEFYFQQVRDPQPRHLGTFVYALCTAMELFRSPRHHSGVRSRIEQGTKALCKVVVTMEVEPTTWQPYWWLPLSLTSHLYSVQVGIAPQEETTDCFRPGSWVCGTKTTGQIWFCFTHHGSKNGEQ